MNQVLYKMLFGAILLTSISIVSVYAMPTEGQTCKRAEIETGDIIELSKTADNVSICENGIITITTTIEKKSPELLHKVRLVEDFPFADLELLSAELKIGGEKLPYSRDVANNKLYFNLGELSGIGTYTLTIKARAFATTGLKTETSNLSWENEVTVLSKSVTFTVVDN